MPKGTLVHGEVYKGEAQKNKIKVYIIIKKRSPRTPESPQWNKPGKLKYSHRKSS